MAIKINVKRGSGTLRIENNLLGNVDEAMIEWPK